MGYSIAIAKVGKSCKFRSSNWGATGGPNEAPVFYEVFAKLNPDKTFYIVGRSDFCRLYPEERARIAPNNNIIDIWEFFDKNIHNPITFPYEYLKENNINIDLGLIYTGSVGRVNIPGIYKKKNGDFCNVIETYKNYAAPVISYLNESNIPYITISSDPRYIPIPADDLLNTENICMTLLEDVKKVMKMKSFEEQDVFVEKQVKCKYTDILSVYLMTNGFDYSEEIDLSYKSKQFLIFHNESKNGNDFNRGKILTEYLLDNFQDVEIFGAWDEKWYKDDRFKQPLKFNELQEILPTAKYTFMIPIVKDATSMKYWESLHFGIIPFMHPLYDISKHLNVPDFIRIKDPQDLAEKIKFLEENPNEYVKLITQLRLELTPEHYNGILINNQVLETINELLK